MKRRSDLKTDIDKIKKLQALQQKATDKLEKIGDAAAARSPLKKKAAPKKPSVKKKPAVTRQKAKKVSFWQKLFGKKSQTKNSKSKEVGFKS